MLTSHVLLELQYEADAGLICARAEPFHCVSPISRNHHTCSTKQNRPNSESNDDIPSFRDNAARSHRAARVCAIHFAVHQYLDRQENAMQLPAQQGSDRGIPFMSCTSSILRLNKFPFDMDEETEITDADANPKHGIR